MSEKIRKEKISNPMAIANSVGLKDIAGKQSVGFVDNRPDSLVQRKIQGMADSYSQAIQLHAKKFVSDSARKHYADGWGKRYGIQDDKTLKEEVPDKVSGRGGIDLGWFDAPEDQQVKGDRRFEQECTIEYADGNTNKETKIFHCGPTGPRHYYDED